MLQQEEQDLVAVVYTNGAVYKRIDLSSLDQEEFKVPGAKNNYNVIEVKDHQVRIKEASCPEQICVHSGWLSKPGQIAVCLPNRLKVVVEGKAAEIDDLSF